MNAPTNAIPSPSVHSALSTLNSALASEPPAVQFARERHRLAEQRELRRWMGPRERERERNRHRLPNYANRR